MRRANPCARSEAAPSRRARRAAKVPRCDHAIKTVRNCPCIRKSVQPNGRTVPFRCRVMRRQPCGTTAHLKPRDARSFESPCSRSAELRSRKLPLFRKRCLTARRGIGVSSAITVRSSPCAPAQPDTSPTAPFSVAPCRFPYCRTAFRIAVPHFRTCAPSRRNSSDLASAFGNLRLNTRKAVPIKPARPEPHVIDRIKAHRRCALP